MQPVVVAVVVALVAGIAGGIQITINGTFGRTIGVLQACCFVSVITTVSMVAVLLVSRQRIGGLGRGFGVPPWMWLGGVMSAILIVGVTYSVPRVGTLATMALLIVGQLAIAVLIDSAGWFGAEQIPFRPAQAVGMALIVLGSYLVLQR